MVNAGLTSRRRTYWGSEIKDHPPSVHYDEIMASGDGVGKWTAKIVSYLPIPNFRLVNQVCSLNTGSASLMAVLYRQKRRSNC
jgi:hypothetical protein